MVTGEASSKCAVEEEINQEKLSNLMKIAPIEQGTVEVSVTWYQVRITAGTWYLVQQSVLQAVFVGALVLLQCLLLVCFRFFCFFLFLRTLYFEV